MPKQIFINLAVTNLQQSMDFYAALGFTNNPQFSDDSGKCMVWSDSIFLMLLTHQKFANFTSKPIADTKGSIAGLFSLSLDSPLAQKCRASNAAWRFCASKELQP